MANSPDIIRLHANDNVVIACKQLLSGVRLESENLTIHGLIPPGHKIATRGIAQGEAVRRYNQVIGFAKCDIEAGTHVHTQNLSVGGEFERDYAFCQAKKDPEPVANPATFQGYVRANGKVGTRNYLAVIPTVNCSATVARAIADPDNLGAEFGIILRPELKGSGLGRILLDKLIRYQRAAGTARLVDRKSVV